MKKVILKSIQPQWVQKILNGEKTIEVRKSAPQCEFPIDIYIYETKHRQKCSECPNKETDYQSLGRIYDYCEKSKWVSRSMKHSLCKRDDLGKVVAKFTLNKVDKVKNDTQFDDAILYASNQIFRKAIDDLCKEACIPTSDLFQYSKGKSVYGWHIENLEIFDIPMELEQFGKDENALSFECKEDKCHHYYDDNYESGREYGCSLDYCPVTKPPQSWQYVYLGGVD